MKRNSRFKLFIVLISLTFLCGCWNVKEINHRTTPLYIGVSKENDDEYIVTMYVPVTHSGESESIIATKKGDTLSNIFRQLRTDSDSALDYSHVQLIVIQEKLAENEEEMTKLIRLSMAVEQLPSQALVVITDDDIKKMFSNIDKLLGTHATYVQEFFYKEEWAPEVSSTHIWELYRSLYSYTEDINVPIITIEKDTGISFKGAAILKKGKFTGRVNPKENLLLNLFHHDNAKGEIESLGSGGVIILNSSLHMTPSMKKNEPLVLCDLKIKIDVIERNDGVKDNQIKGELKELIEKQFYKIFKQAQENKADVFGFGQYFRNRLSYQELKEWRDEYYPKLKVNFQVHVSMK